MEARQDTLDSVTAVPPSRSSQCPVCNSGNVRLRCGGGKPFTDRTQNRHFRQSSYQIFECSSCSFVFKDSILDSEQLTLLYSDVDFTGWENETLYPTEREVAAIVRSLPAGSRILDFGCSSGRLLAQFVDRHECLGFEINIEAAEKAAAKGIRMVDSMGSFSTYTGSMDAVLLMDVFEHLENPLPILQELVGLLKPGGTLIVATGNAECEAGRQDLANFWYFRSIQHVGMLSRNHAEFLSRQLSLRLEMWKLVSHYDASIAEKLGQHLRQLIFRQNKQHPDSFLTALLQRFPVVNRCASWHIPPPFTVSKDHVVAVWRRQSNEAASRASDPAS